MSFTSTRTKMNSFSGAPTAEYQLQYMAKEVRDILNDLNNKFLEYLTDDLASDSFNSELKDWLTQSYYPSSNEYAKECLEHCLTVKHLYGRKLKPWTDAALKCYDNFLLKHIQVDRGESIKKTTKQLKERDVYSHLVELGGTLQDIGQAFHNIYETRNGFHHVQVVDDASGNRIPKRMTNSTYNQKRDEIIGWFKEALGHLKGIMDSEGK
jgi:hypothetical protein